MCDGSVRGCRLVSDLLDFGFLIFVFVLVSNVCMYAYVNGWLIMGKLGSKCSERRRVVESQKSDSEGDDDVVGAWVSE